MLKGFYYVVQRKYADNSLHNNEFFSFTNPTYDLSAARKDFTHTWMHYRDSDTRLVKAFMLDNGEERVSEIISIMKGRP
jgi:CTP:phosphocholine cytidylyltransferase-like protein